MLWNCAIKLHKELRPDAIHSYSGLGTLLGKVNMVLRKYPVLGLKCVFFSINDVGQITYLRNTPAIDHVLGGWNALLVEIIGYGLWD